MDNYRKTNDRRGEGRSAAGRAPPQVGTVLGLCGRCNREGERLSPLPFVCPISNFPFCSLIANGATVVDS